MPCYIVQTTSVEFKAKNRSLLEEALKRMENWGQIEKYGSGYVIRSRQMKINLDKEIVELPVSMQGELNALKRMYSQVCLEEIAKKKRWRLKQMSSTKFQAIRL